jgi:hypothetical protein
MANLNNVSTKELEAELASRKQRETVLAKLKPVPFDQKRHDFFAKAVEDMVYQDVNGEGKDIIHYIYEEAVQYVFGDDAFEKINKLIS